MVGCFSKLLLLADNERFRLFAPVVSFSVGGIESRVWSLG